MLEAGRLRPATAALRLTLENEQIAEMNVLLTKRCLVCRKLSVCPTQWPTETKRYSFNTAILMASQNATSE